MRRSVTARSEATRQFKHSEVMDRRASLAMTEKMFAMTEKLFAMTNSRHCEEQSDAAVHAFGIHGSPRFARDDGKVVRDDGKVVRNDGNVCSQ